MSDKKIESIGWNSETALSESYFRDGVEYVKNPFTGLEEKATDIRAAAMRFEKNENEEPDRLTLLKTQCLVKITEHERELARWRLRLKMIEELESDEL